MGRLPSVRWSVDFFAAPRNRCWMRSTSRLFLLSQRVYRGSDGQKRTPRANHPEGRDQVPSCLETVTRSYARGYSLLEVDDTVDENSGRNPVMRSLAGATIFFWRTDPRSGCRGIKRRRLLGETLQPCQSSLAGVLRHPNPRDRTQRGRDRETAGRIRSGAVQMRLPYSVKPMSAPNE